jgi:hypothetical protein
MLAQALPEEVLAQEKKSYLLKWPMHSNSERERLGVPRDYKPWSTRRDTNSLGVPDCKRMRDVLEVAWAARLKEMPLSSDEDRRRGYYANLTQAVQRRAWGGMHTMLQGTQC